MDTYDLAHVRHGIELLHAVNQADTVDGVMRLFHDVACSAGGLSVSISLLTDTGRDLVWTTAPADWMKAYRDENLAAHDPGYRKKTRPRAFATCRFVDGYPGLPNDQAARHMFLRARDFGITGAVLIPDTSAAGRQEMAALNVMTAVADDQFFEWTNQQRRTLEVLAASVHHRLREIRDPSPVGGNPLSDRERAVLSLFVAGHRNARVAEALAISEKTVEYHVTNARRKLKARTREQAIAIAYAAGWLSEPPHAALRPGTAAS